MQANASHDYMKAITETILNLYVPIHLILRREKTKIFIHNRRHTHKFIIVRSLIFEFL